MFDKLVAWLTPVLFLRLLCNFTTIEIWIIFVSLFLNSFDRILHDYRGAINDTSQKKTK